MPRTPELRLLAEGADWSVAEHVCGAGPADRPFEERHSWVTVAAVVEGSFRYRTEAGAALLHPGAFLLGNAGSRFECSHAHGTGDRCIALQLQPDAFAELARTAGAERRFAFRTPALPAVRGLLPSLSAVEAVAASGDALRIEQAVPRLFDAVVRALAGAPGTAPRISAADERRVSRAVRHIEANADGPLDLDAIARAAATSKYHFLRVFRGAVGATPYQWLLGLRLRRAALQLATTALPVSTIAFASGFGDLSTFNQKFRRAYAATPSGYRRRMQGN
jgi:AraC-like DNA-binding protein